MALSAGRGVVDHDALGLQIDERGLLGTFGLLDAIQRQQLGERAELDGRSG